MIILRQPPYPLVLEYTLPEGNTDYRVIIWDKDRADIEHEVTVLTTPSAIASISLPEKFSKYDESYSVEIYELDDVEELILGEIVLEDNLAIERPYVNPNTLGTTATEIATAKENERLARAIIDSITGGFYYRTSWLETTGQGTDYIALWDRTYDVLKVYENAELVYDKSLETPALGEWNYILTKDRTAITKDPTYAINEFNRAEAMPVGVDMAASDSISMFDTSDSGNTLALKPGVLFNEGADYIFHLATGYKVVPYDIQDATKMLINDIACGKFEYFKRYITDYSTDQFKIRIDPTALAGTGNILVDKILSKYVTNVGKPGIL